jgi:hypothetical protein
MLCQELRDFENSASVQMSVNAASVHRTAGGKITEAWVNFDARGLAQQMGVIPAPGR